MAVDCLASGGIRCNSVLPFYFNNILGAWPFSLVKKKCTKYIFSYFCNFFVMIVDL